MPEISDARQALRNYSRQEVSLPEQISVDGTGMITVGMRGELAGLTFEALQGVLTVCDDIRTGRRVLSPLGLINLIEIAIKEPFER